MKQALDRSDVIFCCNEHQLPPSFRRHRNKIQFLNVFSRFLGADGIDEHQQGPFQLLFIGRFLDVKGTMFALAVFRDFWKQHPDARFTMIGEGPLQAQLEEEIAKEGLSDAVQLVAWLPQDELFSYYQRSHVFFYPSMEAQGMVVTEAMQFGVPILCLEGYGPHSLARECAITVAHKTGVLEQTHQGFLTELTALYAMREQPKYQALRAETRDCYERYLRVEAQVETIVKAFEVD